MSRIEARRKNAKALRVRFSKSLASHRHRLSQAKVRSAVADNDDPTCLAVVATSAELGAGGHIFPERDQQFARQRDDRRLAQASAIAFDAFLEPLRQRRRRRRRDEGCLIDDLKKYTIMVAN